MTDLLQEGLTMVSMEYTCRQRPLSNSKSFDFSIENLHYFAFKKKMYLVERHILKKEGEREREKEKMNENIWSACSLPQNQKWL